LQNYVAAGFSLRRYKLSRAAGYLSERRGKNRKYLLFIIITPSGKALPFTPTPALPPQGGGSLRKELLSCSE
jgi:hypothetical protein